jgi:hypothetical protein
MLENWPPVAINPLLPPAADDLWKSLAGREKILRHPMDEDEAKDVGHRQTRVECLRKKQPFKG